MGFRISYIVTAIPSKDLVTPLGFGLDAETDALPYDEWWVGTLKSNGMTVFWAQSEDFVNTVADELAVLSQSAPIYVCSVNETEMYMGAMCYRDGRAQWQLSWEGNHDVESTNLVPHGDIPAAFAVLAEKAFVAQAEDPEGDHFADVPLALIAGECGFRHDYDMINTNFNRFFRINADTEKVVKGGTPGLLQRMFGR